MTLKKWSLAAFAVALVAPLSASALGISIANVSSTTGTSTIENYHTITFDLVLENATNEEINGLDVGVFGYDRGVEGNPGDNYLLYTGSSTGAGAFGAAYAPGLNLGGLANAAPQQEIVPLPYGSNDRHVRLFGGVAINPVTGDGTNDSGINGLQTNGADVHLQVTFTAQALGATEASPATVDLVFGIGQQGYDVVGPAGSLASQWTNAVYTVTIVPEPGTALLMGLGLAGLATTRRR